MLPPYQIRSEAYRWDTLLSESNDLPAGNSFMLSTSINTKKKKKKQTWDVKSQYKKSYERTNYTFHKTLKLKKILNIFK